MSEQYHFEFNQWREAFEMFYRKRLGYTVKRDDGSTLGKVQGNPKICLVISTAFYTPGYWIEESPTADAETEVYRSVKGVKALEQRFKARREATGSASIGLVI